MQYAGAKFGTAEKIVSKTSISNNEADMYCLYKDHKVEPSKSRPVVTGCSSNTLGLSNSVPDVLESVANSETKPYEVISSEDMLAATKRFNEKYEERRNMWLARRDENLNCETCKFEEIYAAVHPETQLSREEMRKVLVENFGDFGDNETYEAKLRQDCEECGEGICEKDQEVCLLGNRLNLKILEE